MTLTEDAVLERAPSVPAPRGTLSEAVAAMLARAPGGGAVPVAPEAVAGADPFGDDLQLALYCCYELHYRGFEGVDAGWEWDPELLRLRGQMERAFLGALRDGTVPGDDVSDVLDELLVEPVDGEGVSHYLRDQGEWWQMREYLAHRSVYHLKEADPHAWVIPRLRGHAKAALVAVEFDEFGGGRGERVHAQLYADLLADVGLDPSYGAYLDRAPAEMLAIVTMMSMFGLHRDLRGAMVGHFAAAEITTAPSARRLADALGRLGAGPAALLFYTEHIEADAVHEQVLRHDVIGDLLRREPELAGDVVFGVRATDLLEERFGRYVLERWRSDRPTLRGGPLGPL